MSIDREARNQRSREYYQKNKDKILQRHRDYYLRRPAHVKPLRDSDKLVQHHEKYKEIHGEDKVVIMTVSEHRRLHRRLRREGKCNVPPEKLLEISRKAAERTEGRREYRKRYRSSERCKVVRKAYYSKYTHSFVFDTLLEEGIKVREDININFKTNHVYCTSCFLKPHRELKYVNNEAIKQLEDRQRELQEILKEEEDEKT